ncbi:AbrB/MazE/SpoVT family DNA-binding domain-containing protein [Agrobacterium vitis]|uniref:antitoxin n=2 Tax=Agrobacterium vitis TaxID=373 RepID=UPI0008721DCC|nr:AbrB/MazE/SpoVT family DNA-binding domain-containing protein [Agrobacterium vitis]MCE6074328.1 AbrB/MazE/SpoVT family DNA-binding domain-containing protein [Agrobacterium vitis]MCM2452491.1 AbrB/MazE/SpoVT family DNA-binding domain-containing protein [Agrobacterium vitis]MCM2470755.1 AbrB/MazE/SpoVT family DNA-binding domain-containing protein [Agrobacterium vitis]MUO70988.1 AbrB/MazE/SpoVT family DNA-binding domain-containing protein [Agrobacterium vitis]MUO86936.1 AbrB/MazE/SpoVT family D
MTLSYHKMEVAMFPISKERRAKIFMNGRSRAVRIPSDFDLSGDEVVIRQEADGIITIQPARQKRSPGGLIEWLRQAEPLGQDFPEIDDQPLQEIDLDLPE